MLIVNQGAFYFVSYSISWMTFTNLVVLVYYTSKTNCITHLTILNSCYEIYNINLFAIANFRSVTLANFNLFFTTVA